jgi:putative membrane protein
MFLTATEADSIDAQVAAVETRTGVQVVTAVVGKSDNYAELPWKAFALGASLAAFGVVGEDAWHPEWIAADTALTHAVAILGVAGLFALLAIFVPPFGRLFLRATRRDIEVRHYAQSLFLTRELFKTQNRTAVLVVVSLFERRIEIQPDAGLRRRISESEWRLIVFRMAPLLREARPFHALKAGLAAIETLLLEKGYKTAGAPGDDALPDRPIEERGA